LICISQGAHERQISFSRRREGCPPTFSRPYGVFSVYQSEGYGWAETVKTPLRMTAREFVTAITVMAGAAKLEEAAHSRPRCKAHEMQCG
jgi:hypothetical protein